jgi:UDP-glucose:(heptosyl)LPS alpha-1,3-glucosyltransferase
LVECYGIAPERVRVTPSGVDTAAFDPEKRSKLRAAARKALGLHDDRFYFLFVGTDWIRKGMMTILRAMRETPDAELLAIGPYDPEPYRRASERLGVSNRVTYLPRRADVIYYYAAADALLSPSIYEPFGLMPLEAMACGLPALITRGMGVAEIVPRDAAIVLESGEEHPPLAAAMRALMHDAPLRERLAASGVAVARRHSWEAMYQATLDALLAVA